MMNCWHRIGMRKWQIEHFSCATSIFPNNLACALRCPSTTACPSSGPRKCSARASSSWMRSTQACMIADFNVTWHLKRWNQSLNKIKTAQCFVYFCFDWWLLTFSVCKIRDETNVNQSIFVRHIGSRCFACCSIFVIFRHARQQHCVISSSPSCVVLGQI